MKTLSEFLEITEGVEFKINDPVTIYKIENNTFLYKNILNRWLPSEVSLNKILKSKITIIPKLTDKERKWLKNVISPFADEVEDICITVCKIGEEKVYLQINLKYEGPILFPILFPMFEKGKYYNGLQIDENYTLAELGLED